MPDHPCSSDNIHAGHWAHKRHSPSDRKHPAHHYSDGLIHWLLEFVDSCVIALKGFKREARDLIQQSKRSEPACRARAPTKLRGRSVLPQFQPLRWCFRNEAHSVGGVKSMLSVGAFYVTFMRTTPYVARLQKEHTRAHWRCAVLEILDTLRVSWRTKPLLPGIIKNPLDSHKPFSQKAAQCERGKPKKDADAFAGNLQQGECL